MLSRSLGTHKRTAGIGLTAALIVSSLGGTALAQDGAAGQVDFLSTQLEPVEEREKVNNVILADFSGDAEFITVGSTGEFFDQIELDQSADGGELDVLGGLHGEFAALAEQDVLMDLSELAAELDISPALLELGKLGTDQQLYIPWMQATYIMAAHTSALEHLPEGADLNNLTWEQITEWGQNLQEATGEPRLGFPLGADGLRHRLLQGYLYPSFTGGVNTTFATEEGVAMWEWLQDTWQYVNPNASTFSFMQQHLLQGEVDVAWDHTARLIDALDQDPESFVAFAVPSGPEGRGFMPVVAGLGILQTSDNPEGAMELIRHLLAPETQARTLEQVSFFPVISGEVPAEVGPGVQAQLDAIAATSSASDALPSLLPVGLGELGSEYNTVFQNALTEIILQGGDPATVLSELAADLQSVLERAEAECWAPDPETEGVCPVGGAS